MTKTAVKLSSPTFTATLRNTGVIHLANKENTGTLVPTETLTVRLPSQVVRMLDTLVEKKLFNSRSEAIREFSREYVNNNTKRGENQ